MERESVVVCYDMSDVIQWRLPQMFGWHGLSLVSVSLRIHNFVLNDQVS